MEILTNRNVLYIFRRALNRIDYRLVDHSQRVAYLMLRMLEKRGGYTAEEMAEICVLSLWHDIGAYKVEEIRSMTAVNELVHFEAQDVLPHSVYGYLFYRELIDRTGLADTLLYHHIPYQVTMASDCQNKKLATMLFAADRYDLLNTLQSTAATSESLLAYSGTIFDPEAVALLREMESEENLREKLDCGECVEELFAAFEKMQFSSLRLADFLWLLAYSIDFRSPFTVAHTINTANISLALADMLGLRCHDRRMLYLGSIVHDLGKISTPVDILEKPGKLTPEEFVIMKRHVVDTERILEGCVNQEIIDIAVRHHEKIDGSGYPRGLSKVDLSIPQRILAIADVTSALVSRRSYKEGFPNEKVKEILLENARGNKLCPEIVEHTVERFDLILEKAKRKSEGTLTKYQRITDQYDGCLAYMKELLTPQCLPKN